MVNLRCKYVPKERREYTLPSIKLRRITYWTKVAEKVSILLSNLRISRLTPLLAERDSKVAPEMCIVAPIFCKLFAKPVDCWTPIILNKIKETGYELHLKTKILFKMGSDAARLRPDAVYPQFIVDNNKIDIVIGNPCCSGVVETISLIEIEKNIKENDAIILVTSNKRFIAFWMSPAGSFLCYSPPQGYGHNLEYSFILKSKIFTNLYNYLTFNISFQGAYDLFSLKILNKEPIISSLKELSREREERIWNKIADVDTIILGDKDIVLEENRNDIIVAGEPIEMEDIDRSCDSYKLPFSRDFANHYYHDRGFLSGSSGVFVKDVEKIVIANISAAMYLHHIRATLWTRQTLSDILKFGDTLYDESVSKEVNADVYWINRIPQPITFGAKKFKLIFEKIVIGDITTEENFVFSVKQGISALFKHSDLGLIYGPQPQLIWQEAGLYFTFSPKERDMVGRKWTKILTSRLAGNIDSSELPQQGSACVSWFKDLPCLCDAYLANIILKHRKDQYRIIKIKISEVQDTSDDVDNWISYAPGKWRIIGDKSICHYIQNTEGGLAQIFPKSFTIACANSLYAKVYDSNGWSPLNIDEILNYGNDYYKESVHERPDLVNEFNFKYLKKTFILAGKRFQIVIAANKYSGSVFYPKGSSPDLGKALKLYFDDYQYGLILIGDRILPIFQMNSYYHLLFVYDKIFGKTDLCVCSAENIYGDVYGHAFALRFKDIPTMHEEILSIMSMNEDEKYSLYIVEGKDRPPLLNYQQFGEHAAILHPNNFLHEGSGMFNVRADKQTYANIIVTLCYVNMSRPLEWSQEDVADLLKIGDSIYCKITSNLKDCSELYFKLKLEDVTPYIGWNKFNYTTEETTGIFKLYPAAEEEEEGEYEGEEGEGGGAVNLGNVSPEGAMLATQLSQVLSGWENLEQILAILDSRVIRLGLWKKDLVYFVYDSKSSLENGMMTPRRIQRAATTIEFGDNDITDLRHIDNNGSAYVAYFYDLESFIDHILSCIPEEYHSENFTLYKMNIVCPPVPQAELEIKYQPNTSFVITAPNVSIVRASISQDETMFQNPNKQEITNCMVAIAFAYITVPTKWTPELVNIVLKYGDRLYVKSLDRLEKVQQERFCDINERPLCIEDVVKIINIYKVRFKFTIISKAYNCINPGGELNKDIKKLFGRLQNVDNGSGAIVKIKGRSNAVWKVGNTYFLFDPFKCDPVGLIASNGVACLMKFNKFELFMEFFIKKYLCKEGPNYFEVVLLFCEKSMPSCIPGFYLDKYNFTLQRPANQLTFEEIENGMKVMKRAIDLGNKSIKFICLAALLYSRVEYVEVWNFTVFEKIILLGDFLQKQLECKTTIPSNNYLEDVNFSVKIDSILCNIVVHHIIQVSPKTEVESKNLNMHQGLQGFFLEHNNCIITNEQKCYAIWNEGPKFYMVWYRDYDKKLVVLVSPNWENFYNIILDEIGPGAPIYYIKKAIITRIKMIESCEGGRKINDRSEDFDERCRECNFTKFIEEYISKKVARARMNENFKRYCQGIDVLCGDLVKTNEFFDNPVLFCETLKASCLTATAMSLCCHPEAWKKKTLKQIIDLGIDLYKSNVAITKRTLFEITDYENDMNFLNYNINLCVEPPTLEDLDINSILNPIAFILKKSKIAYLGIEKQFFMTIMIDEPNSNYYMFYAGSPAEYVPDIETETSCLVRADSLLRLVTFIVKKRETTEQVLIGAINARFL